MQIREAKLADAFEISLLSGELGYFTVVDMVSKHLKWLLDSPNDGVFVMEHAGELIGWVHIRIVILLEAQPFGEIGGIVVKEQYRRSGIGRILMNASEQWLKANGYRQMLVRSGSQRSIAHTFYENLGYEKLKEQMVYKKDLI